MHVDFLVEGPSDEETLKNIIPIILGENVSFDVHAFQGKRDLLTKLTDRLRGYHAWMPADMRIVVLIDQDRGDCMELKDELERKAQGTGLLTKSAARGGEKFHILNRLAIEELEAWFFGDVKALHAAYPHISINLDKRAKYRNPDAITKPSEALAKLLKNASHYHGHVSKKTVARMISPQMLPERNRSNSFQVFRDGLLNMAGEYL